MWGKKIGHCRGFYNQMCKEDGSYTTPMHYHNMTIAKQSGMSNPNDCSESKFDTHLVLSNTSDTVSSQGDCTGNILALH